MNRISSYQAAALLIVSRLLALSLYLPRPHENPVITCVCAVLLCGLKWLLLMPAAQLVSRKRLFTSRTSAAVLSTVTALGAAVLLVMLTEQFSALLGSFHPERYSRFGITAVLLFICAYVASMDRQGLARTASIILPVILGVMALIFIEMRGAMLPDRLNFFAPDPENAVVSTFLRLLGGSVDLLLCACLMPLIDCRPTRTVGVYLTADALMSLGFFLMAGSVLGSFSTGNLWFTLSCCTHGAVIDRSGAVFLAVMTVCEVLTCSALMLITSRAVGHFFRRTHQSTLLPVTAAVLTVLMLAMLSRNINVQEYAAKFTSSIGAAAVMTMLFSPLYTRKYLRTNNCEYPRKA